MSGSADGGTASADAVPTAVGLVRALRAAGVPAGTDRVLHFVAALDVLDPLRRDDVYWAGRMTLCASAEDLERFDRIFDPYWGGEAPHRRLRRLPPSRPTTLAAALAGAAPAPGELEPDAGAPPVAGSASTTEVLRHRDVTTLTTADRAEVERLLEAFRLAGDLCRTRRTARHRRGRVDPGRTVRALLRAGGEPTALVHRRRRVRRRRVVLLLDVSGSMSGYADALLRFAHAASAPAARRHPDGRSGASRTEVFTLGTRLTRVTRELQLRDVDAAVAAVAAAVPDWSGGTRLGVLLREFLDTWGQRGMARGAVVVVLSDGWERDDPAVLGEQMARLARLAHRVVWANPRKAAPGYAPLAAGMAAALPHIDDFVEGHSLAALERIAAVVAGRTGGTTTIRGGARA